MWTDASGAKGQGAFYSTETRGRPPPSVLEARLLKTTLAPPSKEGRGFQRNSHGASGHPAVAPSFKQHQLVIFTDNAAVFHGLRHRSVRRPAMEPLRRITLLAALHDTDILPRGGSLYVPMCKNLKPATTKTTPHPPYPPYHTPARPYNRTTTQPHNYKTSDINNYRCKIYSE